MISNCCGAYMPDTDILICPECKEHCEGEEEEFSWMRKVIKNSNQPSNESGGINEQGR